MRPLASVVPVSEAVPRVLVVDDSHERRELVGAALLKDGYEVRVLTSVEGVVDALESFEPDLAVLACSDTVDGVALCGELRAREIGHHTPVILVGDESDETTVAHGLLAGADDYVTSARRAVELSARVRVQLRNKRMLDTLGRLRAERDTFRREASHDPLTGLSNRRALEDAVTRCVSRHERFAVLFVDIDHFKSINDTFGHAIGDEVLKLVSERMTRGTRQRDVCARYGGEEFVVLLVGAADDAARRVAERHRAGVEGMRMDRPGYPDKVTVSIGVAAFDPGAPDASAEAFLRRADAALYEAKRSGRNCVVMAKGGVARSNRPDDSPSGTLRVVRAPAPSTVPPPDESVAPPLSEATGAVERDLQRRLESRRTALPILPDVAAAALKLAGDPKTNVIELVKLVEKSPPIAARFLAIANSAIYSRGIKVTSIHVAVVRMGLGGARDVLIQMAYEQQTAELKRYRGAVARSFERSVACAHVCRAASQKLGLRSEYDYLAGLLHDIGEAHVYRVLDTMPEAPSEAVVSDLVWRYHTSAGAEVARAWRLPDEIVRVCAGHHDEAPTSSLLRTVMLADLVVEAAGDPSATGPDQVRLEMLGVDASIAEALMPVARAAADA